MTTLIESVCTFLLVDRSPQTNYQYRLVLNRLTSALGGHRQLSRITYEDLLDHLAALRQTDLALVTINNYLSIYKSFFAWSVRRGYIHTSPAADIALRVPARDPSVNRAIPPDELARLVEYARVTSRRDYALLLFLIASGVRIGGAASLRRENLDLAQYHALVLEKGGRWHTARFGQHTAQALAAWLERRPPVQHTYVWTSSRQPYAPLKPDSISAIVKRIARATGSSHDWTGHFIRHSRGHSLAAAHVPINAAALILGHSDIKITADFYFPRHDPYLDHLVQTHELAALDDSPPPPLRVVPHRRRA